MNEWFNHPQFKKLDPLKQELLHMAARQTYGKSGKAMVPIMMSIISNANKRGIHFNSDEFSLIIDILKDGKTDSEKKQIDHTISMIQQMKKNGRPS